MYLKSENSAFSVLKWLILNKCHCEALCGHETYVEPFLLTHKCELHVLFAPWMLLEIAIFRAIIWLLWPTPFLEKNIAILHIVHYHSREDKCHVWVIKRSISCLEIGMEPKSRVTLMTLIMNLFHAYHGGKTQKVQCALRTARSLCNIPLGKKNHIFPNALLGANKKVHSA